MSKFTPGPWFAEVDVETDVAPEYHIDGRPLVMIQNRSLQEIAVANNNSAATNAIANAALIAAAPELYEACAEFVRKCDAGEARSTRSYAQMKAALRKADGDA